jgi:ubiquinone/menaquinone biosynthesis C-methylase UbiE
MSPEPLDASAVKDVVFRHWGGRAATYDEAPNHALHNDAQRAAWTERLQTWTGSEPLDVLDVGCGTGFLALQCATLGHRVVGMDATAEMLRQARSKADAAGLHVDLRRGDAEAVPFEDARFDLVVERHVVWTLPEPNRALVDWHRVLRPGGRLILIEGNWGSEPRGEYQAIVHALPLHGGRPAAELVTLVTDAGFVDVRVEPLEDPDLWGGEGHGERYAILASMP